MTRTALHPRLKGRKWPRTLAVTLPDVLDLPEGEYHVKVEKRKAGAKRRAVVRRIDSGPETCDSSCV